MDENYQQDAGQKYGNGGGTGTSGTASGTAARLKEQISDKAVLCSKSSRNAVVLIEVRCAGYAGLPSLLFWRSWRSRSGRRLWSR